MIDITNAIPFANGLKSYGSLIAIALDTANINTLASLTSNIFTWNNYTNVPPTLVNSTINAFTCKPD